MVSAPTMEAITLTDFGGPDVLRPARVARPDPGPGEVRIRVAAVGVSGTRDVLTRTGHGPFSRLVSPPHILGGAHAGWVDAVGDGVDAGVAGRRVAIRGGVSCGRCRWCRDGWDPACPEHQMLGIHRPGSYAQYTTTPSRTVFEMPAELSFPAAAALIEGGPVAFAQLRHAAAQAGDVIVVPGINGALGSTVAALARHRGLRVVGLTRHPAQARALPLAADTILDATAADLEDQLRAACGDHGAAAVIDNVCASPAWEACLAVLAPTGRVVVSGTSGPGQATIDTRRLYINNQAVLGVRTAAVSDQHAFWELVSAGFSVPDELLQIAPLCDAARVHAAVQNRPAAGYHVLAVE